MVLTMQKVLVWLEYLSYWKRKTWTICSSVFLVMSFRIVKSTLLKISWDLLSRKLNILSFSLWKLLFRRKRRQSWRSCFRSLQNLQMWQRLMLIQWSVNSNKRNTVRRLKIEKKNLKNWKQKNRRDSWVQNPRFKFRIMKNSRQLSSQSRIRNYEWYHT